MNNSFMAPLTLNDVAHVIQLALTPVFLLSGIAALLNVFSTRLARVAEQVDALAQSIEKADPADAARMSRQLARLRNRSLALDGAVVLATVASVFTGLSILALFVGAWKDAASAPVLFVCFGLAIAATIGSLCAFLMEALMAGQGLRVQVRVQQHQAATK